MTKIRETIDALWAARKDIRQGTMGEERMLNLVLKLVDDMMEVLIEVGEENQQIRAELEAYQERGARQGKMH